MGRHELREIAYSIVFSIEFTGYEPGESVSLYIKESQIDFSETEVEFITDIVTGVYNSIEKIDEIISIYSKGIVIDRISKVALSAMRVCLYEILYRDDIPNSVSINEAVEYVKNFDSKQTRIFVNGVLGAYIKENANEHVEINITHASEQDKNILYNSIEKEEYFNDISSDYVEIQEEKNEIDD